MRYSGGYPDQSMANPKVLNLTDEQKKGIKIYNDAKKEAEEKVSMSSFKNKLDRLAWERSKRNNP